jgi:hypothetical protein
MDINAKMKGRLIIFKMDYDDVREYPDKIELEIL